MEKYFRAEPDSTRVLIRPKRIYGLNASVKGNVHFNNNEEVIYPVERLFVIHNYVTQKQRFIRIPEKKFPAYIIMNPQRTTLAVCEDGDEGESSQVVLYDLNTLKRLRFIDLPNGIKCENIRQFLFTDDSSSLIFLTKPPKEKVYMFSLEDTDEDFFIFEGYPTLGNPHSTATCCAYKPGDGEIIAVSGDNLLAFMAKGKHLLSLDSREFEYTASSMVYLTEDLLLIGTYDNLLILMDKGTIIKVQKACDAELYELSTDDDDLNTDIGGGLELPYKVENYPVLHMTRFSKGFFFVQFNTIFVFEQVTSTRYERKTILSVPPTLYDEETYQIMSITLDDKDETVVVSTRHSQLYVGILLVPETLKTKVLTFEPLGLRIHIDSIVDVTICAWKKSLVTASRDRSIRIWNYETNDLEMMRKYTADIEVVALECTGVILAIGFTNQLGLAQIHLDELNIFRTFNFRAIKCAEFSNYGHLLALAYSNEIAIIGIYTMALEKTLKAHTRKVNAVAWKSGDLQVISAGSDGFIFIWDIETETPLQKFDSKNTDYLSVCVSHYDDPFTIYACTKNGQMRMFHEDQMEEISLCEDPEQLTYVCLSRADAIMFAGDKCGTIFNVSLPFGKGNELAWMSKFFFSKINKIVFSFDETFIIVVTEGGTLAFFLMENAEKKIPPYDSDVLKSEEILVARMILQEKLEQINILDARLKEQTEQFQYRLSQSKESDAEQLAVIKKEYCDAIQDMKDKKIEIEEQNAAEIVQMNLQIQELDEEHENEIEEMAKTFGEKMMIENQKFQKLRQMMIEMRDKFEVKYAKAEATLKDTVYCLEEDYKKQVDERRMMIHELLKEMDEKRKNFIEYCEKAADQTNREMVEMGLDYQSRIRKEKDDLNLWKGRAQFLQMRFRSLMEEYEETQERFNELMEEYHEANRKIAKLNQQIGNIDKDIAERDNVINMKEAQITEIIYKNQELQKYKLVLEHKVAELEAHINPKKLLISDKLKQIAELEDELAGLNQNNTMLMLQLKELKDKNYSSNKDLEREKHRCRAAHDGVKRVCTEIYYAVRKTNSKQELQKTVKELYQKHSNDNDLMKEISYDPEVRDDFQKQRAIFEGVLERVRADEGTGAITKEEYDQQFEENLQLLKEVQELKEKNEELERSMKEDFNDVTRKSSMAVRRSTKKK